MVDIHNTFRIILFSLLFGLYSGIAQAITITAQTDHTIIRMGESFTLTLEADGSPNDDPDFSPLEKDFEILSRNKSTSMQIINGKVSNKRLWVLILLPKREGKLTIPPIPFGSDRSNSVLINVSDALTSQPATTNDDMFLQVTVDPKQAYVQSQLIYTIQVFISTNISNASLSEPELSDADAVVEKLGEDRRYEKLHQGRRYQVVERRYAIFPQQSGRLKISPVVFNAQMAHSARYRFSPFPQPGGRTRRIQSKSLEIDIKAKPDTYKGKAWLPARNVQIEESWPDEPPKFKVGEAITRTLTLGAEGLTAAQLPEIVMNAPSVFKTYPDQPVLNDQKKDQGVIGIRQEKVAMIATAAGSYDLPEIKIHWWNTITQKPEVVRIAKRRIEVTAADGSNKSNTAPPAVTPVNPADRSASLPIAVNPAAQLETVARYWPWVSLFLGLGWLSSLYLLWRQARGRSIPQTESHDQKAEQALASRKQLEKTIKQACLNNNSKAAKQAILAWGKLCFPQNNINAISELGKLLGGTAEEQLSQLNQALYSPALNDWQGQELWQAIQQYDSNQQNNTRKKTIALAPLYP